MNKPAPPLLSILETALYVDDLARAAAFYEGVLGLSSLHSDDRLRAYNVNDRCVLFDERQPSWPVPTTTLAGGA